MRKNFFVLLLVFALGFVSIPSFWIVRADQADTGDNGRHTSDQAATSSAPSEINTEAASLESSDLVSTSSNSIDSNNSFSLENNGRADASGQVVSLTNQDLVVSVQGFNIDFQLASSTLVQSRLEGEGALGQPFNLSNVNVGDRVKVKGWWQAQTKNFVASTVIDFNLQVNRADFSQALNGILNNAELVQKLIQILTPYLHNFGFNLSPTSTSTSTSSN